MPIKSGQLVGCDRRFGWRVRVPCLGPLHGSLLLPKTCQWVGETFLLDALLYLWVLVAFPCAAVEEVAGEASMVSPAQKTSRVKL